MCQAIPIDKNLTLASCLNFTNKIVKDKFLNEWGTKAGIYLIEYKYDPKVF